MADPNNALVKAIIVSLNTALSPTKVYSSVPSGAAMPYVSIDSLLAKSDDNLNALKDQTMVYLTVWTRYRGPKEANDIVSTIYDTLHRARLTMDTGTMIRALVTARGTEPDIDAEIHKGRVTLRCRIAH